MGKFLSKLKKFLSKLKKLREDWMCLIGLHDWQAVGFRVLDKVCLKCGKERLNVPYKHGIAAWVVRSNKADDISSNRGGLRIEITCRGNILVIMGDIFFDEGKGYSVRLYNNDKTYPAKKSAYSAVVCALSDFGGLDEITG